MERICNLKKIGKHFHRHQFLKKIKAFFKQEIDSQPPKQQQTLPPPTNGNGNGEKVEETAEDIVYCSDEGQYLMNAARGQAGFTSGCKHFVKMCINQANLRTPTRYNFHLPRMLLALLKLRLQGKDLFA